MSVGFVSLQFFLWYIEKQHHYHKGMLPCIPAFRKVMRSGEMRKKSVSAHMGVNPKIGVVGTPPNHPLKNRGFSIIFTIHFGG